MTSSDLPLPQQLARLTARSPTAVALIVANLIPIGGVFFAGWDVGTILAIYWLENVAIGLLNVAKILTAQGGGAANPTKSNATCKRLLS